MDSISSPSLTKDGDNVTLTRRKLSVPCDAGTTKPAGHKLTRRGSSTVAFCELEERRGEDGGRCRRCRCDDLCYHLCFDIVNLNSSVAHESQNIGIVDTCAKSLFQYSEEEGRRRTERFRMRWPF